MVFAKLRTAIVMRETQELRFATAFRCRGRHDFLLSALHNLPADAVDTTYGGDYPDVVAYACLPVRAQKAPKGRGLFPSPFCGGGRVQSYLTIIQRSTEVRCDIVMIHEFSLGDGTRSMTYGITVFYDIFVLCYVPKGKFMTSRDARQCSQGHSHSVSRIDL